MQKLDVLRVLSSASFPPFGVGLATLNIDY